MNYLVVIKKHEAEQRRLQRDGWQAIPGIPQEQVNNNKGKWPAKSVYHWTSQTVLTPPNKGN